MSFLDRLPLVYIMKPYITNIILATFVLSLCSCATIFNTEKTRFSIITSEPSNLIIAGDTLTSLDTKKVVTVKRDKKRLPVTVYTDSISKSLEIKPTVSPTTFLNLNFSWLFWVGVIVDLKTTKAYTYPNTVYVNLSDTNQTYLKFVPIPSPYGDFKNIIKVTPFKIVGNSNASVELCYERRTGRFFATQLMASYLLPTSLMYFRTNFNPNIKGYRISIEEKFYLMKSAPLDLYLSFEFDYMKNQYRDVWNFGEKHVDRWDPTYNNINYPDTFGINKQTYSYNLKLGYQHIVKRFSIDLYAGFGLRYKKVKHFDRINPNDEMEDSHSPNMRLITSIEGNYWTVSIPLNVRIGWTF